MTGQPDAEKLALEVNMLIGRLVGLMAGLEERLDSSFCANVVALPVFQAFTDVLWEPYLKGIGNDQELKKSTQLRIKMATDEIKAYIAGQPCPHEQFHTNNGIEGHC